jgi:formate dehydrogenase subunit beta
MKAVKITQPVDQMIKDFCRQLFEKGTIGGVFALTKTQENRHMYSLITKKERLADIDPLFPIMPMNAGKMVSRLTMAGSPGLPIVVIMRPCELRALFELVKLEQARLDNLLLISYTCNGVYSLKMDTNDIAQKLETYWQKTRRGEIAENIRETCQMCTEFVPYNADITINLIGKDSGQGTSLLARTEKGTEYLSVITDLQSDTPAEPKEIDTLRKARVAQKQTIFANLKTEEYGFDGLTSVFGRCINCRACSSVCPICYCTLCYIRSAEKDTLPLTWERQLTKKGWLRIPSDTVMYQLIRMFHVGVQCVGCGMCSDICPTDIPVATLFTKFSEHIQKSLEYVPGKDLEQAMPLAVVNPEDFEDSESE